MQYLGLMSKCYQQYQKIARWFFPEHHTPVWNVVPQAAEISKYPQEKLKNLLNKFEDFTASSSSDIEYTILIEIDKKQIQIFNM